MDPESTEVLIKSLPNQDGPIGTLPCLWGGTFLAVHTIICTAHSIFCWMEAWTEQEGGWGGGDRLPSLLGATVVAVQELCDDRSAPLKGATGQRGQQPW